MYDVKLIGITKDIRVKQGSTYKLKAVIFEDGIPVDLIEDDHLKMIIKDFYIPVTKVLFNKNDDESILTGEMKSADTNLEKKQYDVCFQIYINNKNYELENVYRLFIC